MIGAEEQYLALLRTIFHTGDKVEERTGVGTRSILGAQLRYDISERFPLLTTKQVFWKGVAEELFWFLRGSTNVRSLQAKGVHIWDAWADENGDLGPVYGAQWRTWRSGGCRYDQIAHLMDQLEVNPGSRRHILTAWNVSDLSNMALPPCHLLTQFHVREGQLHAHLYQRSADMFLGVPFNIASYALLVYLMAYKLDLQPGTLVHTFGDVHIYENHMEQVNEQLTRDPRPLPTLEVSGEFDDLCEATMDNLTLTGYDPHPAIKAPVAV